jgi:hypothetical protein
METKSLRCNNQKPILIWSRNNTIDAAGSSETKRFSHERIGELLVIPPTSVDRAWTKNMVLRKLNTEHDVEMEDIGATWKKRKVKLLGLIARAHRYDTLRQVLYVKGTLVPRVEYNKRVGAPKMRWLKETYADAWKIPSGPGKILINEDTPLSFNPEIHHLDIIHQTHRRDQVDLRQKRRNEVNASQTQRRFF